MSDECCASGNAAGRGVTRLATRRKLAEARPVRSHGILGKVCSPTLQDLDLSWGQIPHGNERKPSDAGRPTDRNVSLQMENVCSCFFFLLWLHFSFPSLPLFFPSSFSLSLRVCVCFKACLPTLSCRVVPLPGWAYAGVKKGKRKKKTTTSKKETWHRGRPEP